MSRTFSKQAVMMRERRRKWLFRKVRGKHNYERYTAVESAEKLEVTEACIRQYAIAWGITFKPAIYTTTNTRSPIQIHEIFAKPWA